MTSPLAERHARAAEPKTTRKLVGYGVLGVGLVGVAQWLLKGRQKIESAATRGNAGELK
jgi:hypothetical protein